MERPPFLPVFEPDGSGRSKSPPFFVCTGGWGGGGRAVKQPQQQFRGRLRTWRKPPRTSFATQEGAAPTSRHQRRGQRGGEHGRGHGVQGRLRTARGAPKLVGKVQGGVAGNGAGGLARDACQRGVGGGVCEGVPCTRGRKTRVTPFPLPRCRARVCACVRATRGWALG
jgi:hypothetical protein